MQDADLMLSLAEIAGVFVGFGALISVRSGGPSEAYELMYVRGVVWVGILVVVAALAPVTISRYGIAGHEVWLGCSLFVLALFWGMVVVNNRTPEHAAAFPEARATILRYVIPPVLLWGLMTVSLVLVVLGLLPDLEPALYITAVVAILFQAAIYLLQLVYSRGHPQTASEAPVLPTPATGGSSA
jgi:hypothetical protein